eukprot:6739929-Pyramimonas_sp.AAC.1
MGEQRSRACVHARTFLSRPLAVVEWHVRQVFAMRIGATHALEPHELQRRVALKGGPPPAR